MQRQWVENSSVIAAVGYDNANLALEIEFKNGSVYRYFNVSHVVAEQLMMATSHGRYFGAHIRGRFRERKM